jgi:uncharacterized damage-inducible protein DinB
VQYQSAAVRSGRPAIELHSRQSKESCLIFLEIARVVLALTTIVRGGLMKSLALGAVIFLIPFSMLATNASTAPANAAGEYAKHFEPLSKLSVAVAQAMPPEQYGFRPHPDSMNFSQLMSHIATTNYQFCAGLEDSEPPALPSPTDKDAVVKFLSDSFDYCSVVIQKLTEEQLNAPHNSPDGRLLGREILLAMYIHVAHHRGQAEIYLRDKGIRPPSYRI